MRSDNGIAVLIPSYNRPEILEITLPSWLEAKSVDRVFILAQGSSEHILNKYKEIITKYNKDNRIIFKLVPKQGSIKARNMLLDMISEYQNLRFVTMIDDDYILPNKNFLLKMAKMLDQNDECGAIGGKVIVIGRRSIDPDFFLNLPLNLTDIITKLVGYIFLDIKRGLRYTEYLTSFFMMKKDVVDKKIRYDEILTSPTGFREESDFQLQIKQLGYKLLHDPNIYVIHFATEKGGNRPKMSMGERMYWKARTHTIFILKWNKFTSKRIWYIFCAIIVLFLYRPWHLYRILKGIKEGIITFTKYHKA